MVLYLVAFLLSLVSKPPLHWWKLWRLALCLWVAARFLSWSVDSAGKQSASSEKPLGLQLPPYCVSHAGHRIIVLPCTFRSNIILQDGHLAIPWQRLQVSETAHVPSIVASIESGTYVRNQVAPPLYLTISFVDLEHFILTQECRDCMEFRLFGCVWFHILPGDRNHKLITIHHTRAASFCS